MIVRGKSRAYVAVLALALVAALGLIAFNVAATPAQPPTGTGGTVASPAPRTAEQMLAPRPRPQLPLGGYQIFPRYRLVAYYGTAGTASLGVLGEAPPDRITKRLRAVAKRYRDGKRRVQITYELISSIADAAPGADGDYSHYISSADVRRYVRAAKRNNALLVLDLQPGRSGFLKQAKHFAWALRKPHVGLALDPEWRMGSGEVPGQTIGSVGAREVNRVSSWLARLTKRHQLPQKVFMMHQFRTDMVARIGAVKNRPRLAMVQHVDGFGTRSQKLATYRNVERSDKFQMGFKLFYDEDTDIFTPHGVLRIRPRVDFVSYQ